MKSLLFTLLLIGALPAVFGLASTDSIQDNDPAQSGYQPSHNIDPAVVGSAAFKVLWKKTFNTNELVSKFSLAGNQLTPHSTTLYLWSILLHQPGNKSSSSHQTRITSARSMLRPVHPLPLVNSKRHTTLQISIAAIRRMVLASKGHL